MKKAVRVKGCQIGNYRRIGKEKNASNVSNREQSERQNALVIELLGNWVIE